MNDTRRLQLSQLFRSFTPNVYFQPPSSVKLTYPCIIYHKVEYSGEHANNRLYLGNQAYQVTVIDTDPDSIIPMGLLNSSPMSSITSNFVLDNLNHTILTIY